MYNVLADICQIKTRVQPWRGGNKLFDPDQFCDEIAIHIYMLIFVKRQKKYIYMSTFCGQYYEQYKCIAY